MTTPSAPGASSAAPRPTPRPGLEPGDVLAGRYRLLRIVSDDSGPALLWQATDEVLARPVAVKILSAGGRAGMAVAPRFLEAAGRASGLSHPGLARVYDAAREECPALRGTRTVDVAYVISEWVEGRTLGEVLASDGPLEPADAVRHAQEAAEAVAAAHGRGVAHGRIHPGNLLLTPSGRLRVTDAAVAAAAHRQPVPGPVPGGGLDPRVVRADTRDLGAVLYAMLTARWPAASTEQPSGGLPAAQRPSATTTVYAPRQVRAGVPRALDALVVRTLEPARQPALPPIATPMALVQALAELDVRGPDVERHSAEQRRLPRPPRWLLRSVPKLVALAFLGGVGLAAYQAGQQVGELPRRAGALDALVAATPSPAPGETRGTRVDLRKAPVSVRDFDPFSRDRAERPDAVVNAYDQDPSTTWTTDTYRSAAFGGLKPGVGLLVDLGAPVSLTSVQVGMTSGGGDLELRAANQLGEDADDFSVVARAREAKQVAVLSPSTAPASRYWLVWFTRLPKAEDGKYRAGVAELVFTRSR